MIIKFTKNTKKHRKGQVVKGDYKVLIHSVKRGDAEISNQYELDRYIEKLNESSLKEKPKEKTVIAKSEPEKEAKEKVETEECIPCKNKRNNAKK